MIQSNAVVHVVASEFLTHSTRWRHAPLHDEVEDEDVEVEDEDDEGDEERTGRDRNLPRPCTSDECFVCVVVEKSSI